MTASEATAGRTPKRGAPHAATIGDALLPFAPLLYVAWADGELTPAELASISERAAGFDRLPPATRDALRLWLDPTRPPTPADLAHLLEVLRARAEQLPASARRSLAQAGVALAVAGEGEAALEADTAVLEALTALEDALGMASAEAVRALLGGHADDALGQRPAPAFAAATFDPLALNSYIDADHADMREQVKALLSTRPFRRPVEIDRAAHRQLVLKWCRMLADEGLSRPGFPKELGGGGDVGRAIAVFETLAFHDFSMVVKFGVQFGLFGGSIYMLGTEQHHEAYLPAVMSLELPGCYAMTETGHGSNVRELETIARYDHALRGFTVHTPHAGARKDYIGNAALHGRMATVFAQLEVDGQQHGVHAFLVPLRDAAGATLPGIEIEDNGPKAGLNGVDNGRIRFNNVRIPRENLLNRFGTIEEDGTYSSPITSATRRFFTMLGTLVAGRISIAAAALSASKSGLTIAVRYAAGRRQFGPEGGHQVPILSYRAVQLNLLPRLATAYAIDFALRDLTRRFAEPGEDDARAIESAAAGLKAYASRHTVETLQACREACGGQGYLAENRFAELKADTDVFTTFEGANDVLLQLVVKGMLTEMREQFGELRLWSAMRYLAARTRKAIAALNPVMPRRTDDDHIDDPEFHAAALAYRRDRLLGSLARRLKQRIDDGMDSFDALNACQDHALATARAHVEALLLERFQDGVQRCPDDALRAPLRRLAAIFALSCLDRDRGWFLESGYFEAGKAKAVRRRFHEHCTIIAPEAVALVDAFGIPDAVLDAPIAAR
jgi:acyl-CoA oxidase